MSAGYCATCRAGFSSAADLAEHARLHQQVDALRKVVRMQALVIAGHEQGSPSVDVQTALNAALYLAKELGVLP